MDNFKDICISIVVSYIFKLSGNGFLISARSTRFLSFCFGLDASTITFQSIFQIAKMAKYAKYEKICEIFFGIFITLWIVSRIFVYPLW